jgi:hypothetical protein
VVANYLVLTKVDADPALSAEQSRPKGRLVLPIFIRQGWPQAMSHLPWSGGQAPCYPAFSQLAQHRKCRRYGARLPSIGNLLLEDLSAGQPNLFARLKTIYR